MTQAVRRLRAQFAVAAACWSAALLAALQNSFVQRTVVAPFVAWQARFAAGIQGGSVVVVDLSCAGAEVIALSAAAILAYPLPWRRRLFGLVGVTIWLMALNALRITTLVNVAGTRAFDLLHLYVWPALLILGAAGFVFVWIWTGETQVDAGTRGPVKRLVLVTPPLVAVYAATLPPLLASETVQDLAIRAATVAAAMLNAIGARASTGGSTLVVSSAAFVITPECIMTPLMPIYLACAVAVPRHWGSRLFAVSLFVPVFAVLTVARLLTVALPPLLLGTPLYVTHGFYQLLAGAACIVIAALSVAGTGRTARVRAIRGVILFVLMLAVLARPAASALDVVAEHVRPVLPHVRSTGGEHDIQGAFAIMPGYELALLAGLMAAARVRLTLPRVAAALLALVAVLLSTLVGAGELAAHTAAGLPIVAIRALAIAAPIALFALIGHPVATGPAIDARPSEFRRPSPPASHGRRLSDVEPG